MGAIAWYRIAIVEIPLAGLGPDTTFLVAALPLGAVLIAAPFYRIARKPYMRRHFALYMLPLLLIAPDLLLFLVMYNIATLLFILVLTVVPVFPICAIYERLFAYRFVEKPEQDGEQP